MEGKPAIRLYYFNEEVKDKTRIYLEFKNFTADAQLGIDRTITIFLDENLIEKLAFECSSTIMDIDAVRKEKVCNG